MCEKQYYPLIHFAAKYGWINDPNGLIYHDEVYELYFQHNPKGIEWGNMTWGHARSKDLLHWEEMEPVLYPDENGFMYSGCGIQNDRELLSLPKDALIFFYTAALHDWTDPSKTKFTIRRAYSLDGGKTLIKEGEPVLESLCSENRDPKVFWHEESQAYILVLWLQENEFGIFRSEDLEHFTLSQRLMLEGGYECPNLFQLPVFDSETGEQMECKWVFWAADGFYYIGTFDGFTFTQECERQKANAMNSLPYAAQTFSGTKEVISLSWLCTKCIGLSTTGVISLPRSLSLLKVENRFLISQKLSEIVEKSFRKIGQLKQSGASVNVGENTAIRLLVECKEDWTMEFLSKERERQAIVSYKYAGGSFIITHGAVSTFVLLGGTANNLEIIYDQGIFEIASGDGTMLAITDIPELRIQNITKVLLREGTASVICQKDSKIE